MGEEADCSVWLLKRRVEDSSVFAYAGSCPYHCKDMILFTAFLVDASDFL